MRTKQYRVRVRECQGTRSWFAPGFGGIRRICWGKECTHKAFPDRDEALKLAERVSRMNGLARVRVLYGNEEVWSNNR